MGFSSACSREKSTKYEESSRVTVNSFVGVGGTVDFLKMHTVGSHPKVMHNENYAVVN